MGAESEAKGAAAIQTEVQGLIVLDGLTKRSFTFTKQNGFRKALAKTASVSWSDIRIISISSASKRRNLRSQRQLLSGIYVRFAIATSSVEEGQKVVTLMSADSFRTSFAQELKANAVISSTDSVSFDKDSLVTREQKPEEARGDLQGGAAAAVNNETTDEKIAYGDVMKVGIIVFGVVAALSCLWFCTRKSSKIKPARKRRRSLNKGTTYDDVEEFNAVTPGASAATSPKEIVGYDRRGKPIYRRKSKGKIPRRATKEVAEQHLTMLGQDADVDSCSSDEEDVSDFSDLEVEVLDDGSGTGMSKIGKLFDNASKPTKKNQVKPSLPGSLEEEEMDNSPHIQPRRVMM